MIPQSILRAMGSTTSGGTNRLVRAPLAVLATIFGTVVRFRGFLFDCSFFRARGVNVPVISVGNITVGGTGKTQAVMALAGELSGNGIRVGIVCRSYSGTLTAGLVSDGSRMFSDVTHAGDEPYLLAKSLPGVRVGVAIDRVRFMRSYPDIELWILDDGFQHRWAHRDIDIVLLDASGVHEPELLLPAGRYREPFSGLSRADIVVITRTHMVGGDTLAAITGRVQRVAPRAEILYAHEHLGTGFLLGGQERLGRESIPVRAGVICTAIGNPAGFRRLLADAGIAVTGEILFPDHHRFTESDRARMDAKTTYFVTTKDAVKLSDDPVLVNQHNVWVIESAFVVRDANGKTVSWLEKVNRLRS